jgi:simple sugar transport system permease protein
MLPLIMVALAWSLASSGGLFNVGLSGQLICGGIGAAVVALHVSAPTGVHLFLASAAGALAGMIWVGIAVVLWARRGVNEVISTLLLNFIAAYILSWVVRGPLMAPGQPFPQSSTFADSATWPALADVGGLNWDIIVVGAALCVVTVLLLNSAKGI